MNVSGNVDPHSDPQLGSNTVGPKMSVAGAASIAGFSPVPSSATTTDGLNGSSDEIVNVAVRRPPADGLNRTLMLTALPAPSVNGSDGAPTTAKSAAFAPLIASPVTCRSQNAHDAWFETVVVSVFVGRVRPVVDGDASVFEVRRADVDVAGDARAARRDQEHRLERIVAVDLECRGLVTGLVGENAIV